LFGDHYCCVSQFVYSGGRFVGYGLRRPSGCPPGALQGPSGGSSGGKPQNACDACPRTFLSVPATLRAPPIGGLVIALNIVPLVRCRFDSGESECSHGVALQCSIVS
ncbi:unnamed protein product, partial [Laminaria digitata]